MVSPADSWEDTEHGYEKNRVGVYVEPIVFEHREGASFERTVGREDANAYAVSIIENRGTSAERHRTLTRFEEQRLAWKLAHILTRYIDHIGEVMIARSNLAVEAHSDEGGFPSLCETDAESAFREALGHYEHHADEIL